MFLFYVAVVLLLFNARLYVSGGARSVLHSIIQSLGSFNRTHALIITCVAKITESLGGKRYRLDRRRQMWQHCEHFLNPIVTWLFEGEKREGKSRKELTKEKKTTKNTKTSVLPSSITCECKKEMGNDMLCLLQMAMDGTSL